MFPKLSFTTDQNLMKTLKKKKSPEDFESVRIPKKAEGTFK